MNQIKDMNVFIKENSSSAANICVENIKKELSCCQEIANNKDLLTILDKVINKHVSHTLVAVLNQALL